LARLTCLRIDWVLNPYDLAAIFIAAIANLDDRALILSKPFAINRALILDPLANEETSAIRAAAAKMMDLFIRTNSEMMRDAMQALWPHSTNSEQLREAIL
jgi:hypothetical protein